MRHLRTIIASALLAVSISSMAEGYPFLSVSHEDGGLSFPVSQIERITFDAAFMTVHLADGSAHQLPLSSLEKMFFADTDFQGIAPLAGGADQLHIADGELRLQLSAGEKAYIYDMKGALVYATNRSGTFRLDSLRKGVYIVRVGNVVRKVLTK